MKKTNTVILTRGAILTALSVVLSLFAVFKLPNGGAVTIGSMLPIVIFSFCYPAKWALLVSLTYSLLQMALGFYPPPANDMLSFLLVIILDYVVAYGVIGLAGSVYRRFRSKKAGMLISAAVVFSLRFLCHFLSGILIWNSFAPEGQPVWLYSLLYNGSYMGLELLISGAILMLLSGTLLSPSFQEKTGISL